MIVRSGGSGNQEPIRDIHIAWIAQQKISDPGKTWEGEFPTTNTEKDGFEHIAPVKSYPPNPYYLYDMAGNVWEWTQDWYNVNFYQDALKKGVLKNSQGAETAYNPNNLRVHEKVINGGSFLCHASYYASFRISVRMANSTDSALEHLGFRTVATADKISK